MWDFWDALYGSDRRKAVFAVVITVKWSAPLLLFAANEWSLTCLMEGSVKRRKIDRGHASLVCCRCVDVSLTGAEYALRTGHLVFSIDYAVVRMNCQLLHQFKMLPWEFASIEIYLPVVIPSIFIVSYAGMVFAMDLFLFFS